MEDKIVLDRKSFEALAADTRVKIMKSLKERRKTLSELSKELMMSVSGTKEHLQNLEDADLIEKIDDGHKWKYYELTKKGKEIIGPREIKVWILLSISTVALIFSVFALLPTGLPQAQFMDSDSMENLQAEPPEMLATTAMPEAVYESAAAPRADDSLEVMMVEPAEASKSVNGEQEMSSQVIEFPIVPLVVGAISSLSILGCAAILIHNRRS